jgi:hypothetical protein
MDQVKTSIGELSTLSLRRNWLKGIDAPEQTTPMPKDYPFA